MSARPPQSPQESPQGDGSRDVTAVAAETMQRLRAGATRLRRLGRLASRFDFEAPGAAIEGNRVRLLVNGEGYFPQLLAALEAARRSVWVETYIFADDNIGERVVRALADAAARGVEVRVVIDGYGGGEHARALVRELGAHGVHVKIYRPERWWRFERKLLRRLHRKIVVVDDTIAFVGGINIIDDYNHPPGEKGRLGPRFDFAVAVQGPLVGGVAHAARRLWWALSLGDLPAERTVPPPRQIRVPPPFADGVATQLLLRDNFRNRRTIERAYLAEIEASRHEVLIACAYFLPGRRVRAALHAAGRRGVRVRLLLQGRVEYALQHYAQRALYANLLAGGIEIHEYLPSYLHAKVAVIDGRWATVGSSNIDPYSLLLAREANVVVYDEAFAAELKAVLERAIADESKLVKPEDYAARGRIAKLRDWAAYLVVRFLTVVLARGRGY
jgi:cardiolipin synthase